MILNTTKTETEIKETLDFDNGECCQNTEDIEVWLDKQSSLDDEEQLPKRRRSSKKYRTKNQP